MQIDRDIDRDIETAIHEAGHAVADYRLGHGMGSVSIVANESDGTDGRAYGECRCFFNKMGETIIAESHGVSLLAGHAAVAHRWPEFKNLDRGQNRDEEEVLHYFGGELKVELLRRAALLVAENWKQIEAIAERLCEKKEISEDDIICIVDAIDDGLEWRRFIDLSPCERMQLWKQLRPDLFVRMKIPPMIPNEQYRRD